MKIRFVKKKDTKNAVQFQEEPAGGQPPKVGSLYVKKWALTEMGDPKTVVVTIEAGDG